jgi:hypothetical protein
MVWALLFVQNVDRYFHGWGQDALVFGIGIIPVIGIALAIFVYRRASARALLLAILMLVIAAIYIFGAETGAT